MSFALMSLKHCLVFVAVLLSGRHTPILVQIVSGYGLRTYNVPLMCISVTLLAGPSTEILQIINCGISQGVAKLLPS